MDRNSFTVFAFMTLLATLLTNCAVPQAHYDQGVDAGGKPNWVAIGTQTSTTTRGRIFIGVGEGNVKSDFERQSSRINQMAKQEIERMLGRYIEVLVRDYLASGAARKAGFQEKDVSHQISTMTEILMPSAQILDHWLDPANDRLYAIAEIEYTQMVAILVNAQQVNAGIKQFLKQKGESVFDRIATYH